ncbi:cytochrome p450 [Colletotrichum incanum]|uniref:Cytochrome p450 n=1 Tax=Colletotrichum incanum TaxID=1573173 RepID=A0A167BGN9_COLIC|nr:cytochrome p450 [Colletotrichum incanum]
MSSGTFLPTQANGQLLSPTDINAGGKRARRAARPYQCAHCSKVFKRSEHCIRHERSHTNEKPYKCQYCLKTYSRKDLVTRHERTLHAEQNGKSIEDQPESDASLDDTSSDKEKPQKRRRRASLAPLRQPTWSETQRRDSCTSTLVSNSIVVATQPKDATQDSQLYRQHSEAVLVPPYQLARPFTSPDDRLALPLNADPNDRLRHIRNHETIRITGASIDQPSQRPEGHSDGHSRSLYSPALTEDVLTLESLDSLLADSTSQSLAMPGDSFDFNQALFWGEAANGLETPSHQYHGPIIPNGSVGMSQDQPRLMQNTPRLMTQDLAVAGIESESRGASERNLPCLLEARRPSKPNFAMDKSMHDTICIDVNKRLTGPDASKEIPSLRMCQSFVSSYIECYHCHLPIIHLQTLSHGDIPSPLVLAMCSIGALYRLDRRRARRLWDLGLRLIEPVLTRDCPLWVVQTKFLLSFFATFSGDKDLAIRSIGESNFNALLYTKVRNELASDVDLLESTWADWVQRESWKRLLGGIYVMNAVNVIIYGFSPIFDASNDLEIEHFHDENLWNAASEKEWRKLLSSYRERNSKTTKEILEDILSENTDEARFESYHISPFSTLVLMHAVFIHTWQLSQISRTSKLFCFSPKGAQSALGNSILATALDSLDRCHELLKQTREGQFDETDDKDIASLCFSSQPILRAAYIRLFDITSDFDRLTLLAEDPKVIDSSVRRFAEVRLQRDENLLHAIEKAMESFQISVKMGYMLVRKTAAFRWSIEHAVTAWDNILFTTKWAHSVELDAIKGTRSSTRELEILGKMKIILEDADCDPTQGKSIAAGLARACSLVLQDTWVWGITVRMGDILERLAVAYECINDDNQRP